jgi:hypothetical protein
MPRAVFPFDGEHIGKISTCRLKRHIVFTQIADHLDLLQDFRTSKNAPQLVAVPLKVSGYQERSNQSRGKKCRMGWIGNALEGDAGCPPAELKLIERNSGK